MSSTRLTVHGVWSDNADFSELKQAQKVSVSSTSDTKRLEFEGVSAATGGTTLDLSPMTTITRVIISNKDATLLVSRIWNIRSAKSETCFKTRSTTSAGSRWN